MGGNGNATEGNATLIASGSTPNLTGAAAKNYDSSHVETVCLILMGVCIIVLGVVLLHWFQFNVLFCIFAGMGILMVVGGVYLLRRDPFSNNSQYLEMDRTLEARMIGA